MLRASGSGIGLVCFMLAGCGSGSEKELPKNITAPTDRGPELTAPVVPKISDPEAAKFVQARIASATENHPERLEKLKTCRMEVKVQQRQGMNVVPVTRTIAGVWPDRFYFADESNVDGPLKLSFGMRQNVLSLRKNGKATDDAPPEFFLQVLKTDSTAQVWLPMLVPLLDPGTVVFNPKKQSLVGRNWDTVQASIPGCPIYTLWFDEKSNLLGGITYISVEGERKFNKQYTILDYKPVLGVMQATRFELDHNGTTVETWSVLSRDFPEKIEDAVFDQK